MMPCLRRGGRPMFGVWGSIFQVRRFSDGRLPSEKWTSSRDFRFFRIRWFSSGSQFSECGSLPVLSVDHLSNSSVLPVLFKNSQFSSLLFASILQFS